MIDHNSEVIFIHIPKNAGQSVENFFLKRNNLNWASRKPLLLMGNDNHEIGPPALAHLKASEYLEYCYISRDIWNRYFKFTFVRNPYSRLFSTYRYFKYHKICSFNYYIKNIWCRERERISYFYDDQYSYIYNLKGELMVDYIGKFEEIKTDWETILTKLNLTLEALPYVNKSTEKTGYGDLMRLVRKHFVALRYFSYNNRYSSYRDAYNSRSKLLVEKYYERDLDTFNYCF